MSRDTLEQPTQVMNPSDNGHEDVAAPEGSILASLRARREEIATERTVDLPVPGYEGRVVLTCKPVDYLTFRRIAARMEKSSSELKELYAAADTLIAACQEIRVRDDDGKLVSLDPSGDVVRFDEKLGKILGVSTAREALFALFDVDDGMSVITTCGRFNEWVADASVGVDDEFRER